jgi:hypothetical protein
MININDLLTTVSGEFANVDIGDSNSYVSRFDFGEQVWKLIITKDSETDEVSITVRKRA